MKKKVVKPLPKKKPVDKYGKFTKWCVDEICKLLEELNLNDNQIHFADKPTFSEDGWAMRIRGCYPYKNPYIEWTEETYNRWRDKEYSDVRYYLIHELSHILIAPLAAISKDRFITEKSIDDTIERITDHLAIIFKRKL